MLGIVMLIAPIISAILYYILISFLIFVCEEIWAEYKKFKRIWRYGMWDIQWKYKLFKEGFKKHEENYI